MKSLKNFIERFEKMSQSRQLWLKKENIAEERVIAYNDLGNDEQYIVKKDGGFGENSRVEGLGDEGEGMRTSFPKIEVMSFRSSNYIDWNKKEYFIRFNLNHAISDGDIIDRINLEDNVVSLDMKIFKKNKEHHNPIEKVFDVFNLHYGAFEGKVISKDIHHNKHLLELNQTCLGDFMKVVEGSMFNDEFRSSITSGNNFGNVYRIGFREEELYKSLMSQEEINSKLIFPNLKKRDISNPYQGMDLFFDIVDKIKEKTR